MSDDGLEERKQISEITPELLQSVNGKLISVPSDVRLIRYTSYWTLASDARTH